jgi:hypothetical protein
MITTPFLPGTGRGTTKWWRGTRDGAFAPSLALPRLCPSTILRMVPLPVPGRN